MMAKSLFHAVFFLLLFLLILFTGGCSSLRPKQEREPLLRSFLDRPERYALYFPAALAAEEKVKLFGLQDAGETFSRQFCLGWPIVGLMERFISAISDLQDTRIVDPGDARGLPVAGEELVLFFSSDWWLVYRRIPPNFYMNRLEVGVVAKVIPLEQVLAGKGTIALRTAAWEGTCHYEAFGGDFFHLQDWAAKEGARLRQGIEMAQDFCSEKLSREFIEEARSVSAFP